MVFKRNGFSIINKTMTLLLAISLVQIGAAYSHAAGNDYSLALKKDGTVWSWGQNYEGTLGDGTTVSRFSPVLIASLTDVVSIATRVSTALSIKVFSLQFLIFLTSTKLYKYDNNISE